MWGDDPKALVVREVLGDATNYMNSGTLMLSVIKKLDDAINFNDFKTRANLGDVYEKILNDLRSAGNAGEFYTPRAITQFMVEMVNPRLDKQETVEAIRPILMEAARRLLGGQVLNLEANS